MKTNKSKFTYYNTLDSRDAKIVSDSIWREKTVTFASILILKGNKYYYRDISFKGNTLYTRTIEKSPGINMGDTYKPTKMENRLRFSMDGTDVSSLYLDDGYLAFNADPVGIYYLQRFDRLGDSHIWEEYNSSLKNCRQRQWPYQWKCHPRELRTRPGAKFSRSDLIRSQREIINLGYFKENIGINTR